MPEAKTPDLERTRKRIIADHRKGKKPKELSEKYGHSYPPPREVSIEQRVFIEGKNI